MTAIIGRITTGNGVSTASEIVVDRIGLEEGPVSAVDPIDLTSVRVVQTNFGTFARREEFANNPGSLHAS